MKTRLGALIVMVAGFWGCGGDAVTNPPPPPPITAPPTTTPTPRVTLRPVTPQPTPGCRNHKQCDQLPF
jgi:hypothetical protein